MGWKKAKCPNLVFVFPAGLISKLWMTKVREAICKGGGQGKEILNLPGRVISGH